MEKLLDPNVQGVINENQFKFEPFAYLVDTALLNFHSNSIHNLDSFAQQENDEVEDLTEPQDVESKIMIHHVYKQENCLQILLFTCLTQK